MRNFGKMILGAAVLVAFSAPQAKAQVDDPVMIGSNIEYNIGLGFGVNFTSGISDDSYYSPMQKAWGLDFSFNFAEFYWSGLSQTNQFYLTLGLENKSFRMRDKVGYFKSPIDGTLGMNVFAEDQMKMSALRVFSWNVGMGYRYAPSEDLSFMIGPIVNFNTGSRIKTKYHENPLDSSSDLKKDKTKFGHQELVTIEFMGRINFHGIGLYVKYNPFPLIEKAYGPEFTTWSVGIML